MNDIAGACLLVRPVWPSRDGARQLHQPSRPRGELGMPPLLGRPKGYLPGAPDEPPSPPEYEMDWISPPDWKSNPVQMDLDWTGL